MSISSSRAEIVAGDKLAPDGPISIASDESSEASSAGKEVGSDGLEGEFGQSQYFFRSPIRDNVRLQLHILTYPRKPEMR